MTTKGEQAGLSTAAANDEQSNNYKYRCKMTDFHGRGSFVIPTTENTPSDIHTTLLFGFRGFGQRQLSEDQGDLMTMIYSGHAFLSVYLLVKT